MNDLDSYVHITYFVNIVVTVHEHFVFLFEVGSLNLKRNVNLIDLSKISTVFLVS